MVDLQPCRGCKRHVKSAPCPFCGHGVATRPTPEWQVGRMSRAMVFASVTLVSSACGGSAKKADNADDQQRQLDRERDEHYQNHPCSDPDPNEIARLEKKKADAQTDEEKKAADEELQRAKMPMCAPYGAPPAKRRVV